MGRSADKIDDLPTVGIYGIGMKRAIFKIGKSASVITRNNNTLYKVTIPLNWASSEDTWDFSIEEMENKEELQGGGTRVEIENINEGIAENWNTEDKLNTFIDRLIKSIQESYSFIIQKGFHIEINKRPVSSLPLQLLMADIDKGEGIKPFLYKQTFGDVSVSLAVGFYAPPPSPEDIDDEKELRPIINVEPSYRSVYTALEHIAQHPEEVTMRRQQSVDYVRKHHNYVHIAKQYEAFYNRLVISK